MKTRSVNTYFFIIYIYLLLIVGLKKVISFDNVFLQIIIFPVLEELVFRYLGFKMILNNNKFVLYSTLCFACVHILNVLSANFNYYILLNIISSCLIFGLLQSLILVTYKKFIYIVSIHISNNLVMILIGESAKNTLEMIIISAYVIGIFGILHKKNKNTLNY